MRQTWGNVGETQKDAAHTALDGTHPGRGALGGGTRTWVRVWVWRGHTIGNGSDLGPDRDLAVSVGDRRRRKRRLEVALSGGMDDANRHPAHDWLAVGANKVVEAALDGPVPPVTSGIADTGGQDPPAVGKVDGGLGNEAGVAVAMEKGDQ